MKGEKDMRKSSIFDREKVVAFVALVVVLVLAGIMIGRSMADRPAWDVCYDMTNKNIEWTYAGK